MSAELMRQGAESFGRGDYSGALACFARILRANPRDSYALSNGAAALAQLGRFDEALQTLDTVPAGAPAYAEALCNRAYVLGRMGRGAEALACLDRVLAMRPRDFAVLGNRAQTLLEQGRLAEAAQSLQQAAAVQPGHVETLHLLGHTLAGMGRHEEALPHLERALALAPQHPGALSARGFALVKLGRHEEAAANLERLLRLQPDLVEALVNHGVALVALKRYDEALAALQKAVALAPRDLAALDNCGVALDKLKRYDEALDHFDRALALQPDHVEALCHRAIVLENLNRHAEALQSAECALAVDPRLPLALELRGHTLQYLGRHQEALEALNRLLEIDPKHLEGLVYRAITLMDLFRADEALASIDLALYLDPRHLSAIKHRGVVLDWLNRRGEALGMLEQALALDPQCSGTHYNHSLVCLALGRLEEGFREMEHRWDTPAMRIYQMPPRELLWLGDRPLEGKTILLRFEQGFGDTLQFARYVPLVARLGARVILCVPAPLRTLLASLPCETTLVAEGETLPPFDCYCPLLSLPLAFGTTLDTIPATGPYLRADSGRTGWWAAELGPRSRPRIGVVWAGRQKPVNAKRDMALAGLLPLFELPAEWISLQKEVPASDQPALQQLPQLARHGEELVDFADTAALIQNLDLVITVDSAVAHLAGALGKPVWIMNRYAACWRWLEQRGDSPWYPTARLFRQSSLGDWTPVVAQVRQAAASFLQSALSPRNEARAASASREVLIESPLPTLVGRGLG